MLEGERSGWVWATQGLEVLMRNLVVFQGQVLGSHRRAVREGATRGVERLKDHLGGHGLEGGG